MTTIITRLYPDRATAQSVADALAGKVPGLTSIDIITRDGAEPPTARMRAARVPTRSAEAYGPQVTDGKALLIANAPFAPMGTAMKAIRTVNLFAAIAAGVDDEDAYIREEPVLEMEGRVFKGTVFFMSNPRRPLPQGHILGKNPLRPSRPRTSAIRGGAYMSTKFWPMKLLSRHKDRLSVTKGTFLFSSLFGIPTLVKDWTPRTDVPTILK